MSKQIISCGVLIEEVIDTPESEIIEENVYVDESFIKNKSLVRMDMNIVQFPIFSKNTKRKVNQIVKYYFNSNKDTYITVKPTAGDYIPGETEEKVFIALMQIMKDKGLPKKFIVLASELRDRLNLNKTTYNNIVSKSLSRLANTNYEFKNTLYSSEYKGIIGEKIETSIFNIRTISLSKKENKSYREMYNDKRIKIVYEIEFSDHFYNNIIQKGYMVYNGNTLLGINSSTARTIYMLIEKMRFYELYLRIDTIFLIKRIPLKFNKLAMTKTIKTIENSLEELKEKKLISGFNFIKEKTWEKSEIEIFFPESSNENKQQRFFDDKNDLRKLLGNLTISKTEHDILDEVGIVEQLSTSDITVTEEMIDKILGLMPSKARTLKTMPKTIKEAIEQYGYSKVESAAIYVKKNKVDKVRAYFLKALEQNWVEDIEEVVAKPIVKPVESQQLLFETDEQPKYNEKLYEEFLKFPQEIQEGIENYAYRDYIQQCGIETKIQQIAFKGSRKKYICEFLEKNYNELKNQEHVNEEPVVVEPSNDKPVVVQSTEKQVEIKTEQSEELIINVENLKQMVEEAIYMADIIHSYSEDDKKQVASKIIQECMRLFRTKALTLSAFDKIVDELTGV